jgi:hypothetical protein
VKPRKERTPRLPVKAPAFMPSRALLLFVNRAKLIGDRSVPQMPAPYLLHPDEAEVVEAIRRGRRAHPYSGSMAA